MHISILAAVAENGVIGRDGRLPWHLGDDLKRFKRLTMGHTIVMGRKTWESIGRPLKGRRMVVITRQTDYRAEGVEVMSGLDRALEVAATVGEEQVFVIGGGEIYRLALPRADRLYITRVHANVEGDAYFPELDANAWRMVESDAHAANDENDHPFTFETYEQD
jgi:dihydrofolate reductase